jgi:hypothetical protein
MEPELAGNFIADGPIGLAELLLFRRAEFPRDLLSFPSEMVWSILSWGTDVSEGVSSRAVDDWQCWSTFGDRRGWES